MNGSSPIGGQTNKTIILSLLPVTARRSNQEIKTFILHVPHVQVRWPGGGLHGTPIGFFYNV